MVGTLGEKRATDILGKRMGLGHGMSYRVPGLLLSQKQTKKATQPMEMKFHFLFTAHNLPGHLLFYIIGLKFAEPVVIPWSFLFKIVKFL